MRTPLLLFGLTFLMSSCFSLVFIENPLSSEEHLNLGYIYERQGKLELAEQEYRRAIKKDKKNWLAYYNLGNVHLRKGKWEEAEELYRKTLEIRRDPDTMNNLAYLLNRKGEHCEALELIREALRKAHRKEYIETREEIEKALKEKDVKCLNFEGELW
ncbi:MAG: tetratricopeptide repeat protein [Aquificaceae bacterium]|nr:tetratricopeptide repeat protein [Aquificaceae bacterium]